MPTVSRKTKTTRAQKRQEVQTRILAAVERLLGEDEQSFTELSVEALVTEAGISRSTFYVYFEDKGDLLTSLARGVIDGLIDAAGTWWSMGPDSTRDDLRAAMDEIVDAWVPHRVVMKAVIGTESHDPRVREQFGALVDGAITGVAVHIEEGQRSGFVRPGLDPKRTAAWLTWMTERGLARLVADAAEDERHLLVDALTEVVWNALYVAST